MKIGVISDTHGDVDAWEKIWEMDFAVCDLIIHAGDVLYHGPRNPIKSDYNPVELAKLINSCKIPMLITQGNCDAYVDSMVLDVPIIQPPLFTSINGLNIVVHHGHELAKQDVFNLVKKYKADIFISGHTHIPELYKINNCYFLNPGSCSLPKNDIKEATYALIEDNFIVLKNLKGTIIEQMDRTKG